MNEKMPMANNPIEKNPEGTKNTGEKEKKEMPKRKPLEHLTRNEGRVYIDRLRKKDLTDEEKSAGESAMQELKMANTELKSAIQELAIDNIEGLPEGRLDEYRQDAADFIEEYYRRLGIDNVPLEAHINFIPNDLTEEELPESLKESDNPRDIIFRNKILNPEYTGCNSNITEVHYIKVPRAIKEDADIQELLGIQITRLLVHESYHGVAPEKIIQSKAEDNDLHDWNYRVGRMGLEYTYPEIGALEEGLAILTEYELAKKALESYSGSAAEDFKDSLKKIEKEKGIPPETIVFHVKRKQDTTNESSTVLDNHLPNSVTFVKFIKEKMEEEGYDFRVLAEEARIHHKTITLAKAVESVFGKGTYRKIATATEESAPEVLEELKERLQS